MVTFNFCYSLHRQGKAWSLLQPVSYFCHSGGERDQETRIPSLALLITCCVILGENPLPLLTSVSSAVKLKIPAMVSYYVVELRVCLNLLLVNNCVRAGHKVFPPFPPNSFFLMPGARSCLIIHAALCWLAGEPQLQGPPSSAVPGKKSAGEVLEASTIRPALNRHLLSSFCIPGLMLDPENTAMKTAQPVPSKRSQPLQGLHIWGWGEGFFRLLHTPPI